MPGASLSQSNPHGGQIRSVSPSGRGDEALAGDHVSMCSGQSVSSFIPSIRPDEEDEMDEATEQDTEELWFPGCHADLGGGWPLAAGEKHALSHAPLVWMVKEAEKAGLEFDVETMMALRCHREDRIEDTSTDHVPGTVPDVQVDAPTPSLFRSPPSGQQETGWMPGLDPEESRRNDFHHVLHTAATKGVLHDCLEFNNGLGHTSVLSWKMMEYLPFRRMDLKSDGSWAAISFPLPMGEVRKPLRSSMFWLIKNTR